MSPLLLLLYIEDINESEHIPVARFGDMDFM